MKKLITGQNSTYSNWVFSYGWVIYTSFPASKAQGTLWKRWAARMCEPGGGGGCEMVTSAASTFPQSTPNSVPIDFHLLNEDNFNLTCCQHHSVAKHSDLICNAHRSDYDPMKTRSLWRNFTGSSFLQEVQFQPEYFHSTIICERPNNHLSKFKGYM